MKPHCLWLGGAVIVVVVAAAPALAVPAFVGAEKCKPCHLPEYGSWTKAKHAGATEHAKAAEGFSPACLKCHATNADEKLAGVQCESCHGPGSDYWPIPVMFDAKKAVAKGLIVPDQKLCDTCHDGADHHSKVAFSKDYHTHREKHDAKDVD